MTGVQLRAIAEDEFESWARTAETTFFIDPDKAYLERWRATCELDRTIAAFDGDRIVGTAAAMTMPLSVPGGELGMAGITDVGVLPTHRRRGILTAMVRQQLADVAARGEPLAGLFAAEAPIYGRYGYGAAAPQVFSRIAATHSAFRPEVVSERGVELVDVDTALATFPAIREAVRRQRPGMPHLPEPHWRAWLTHDREGERDGYSRRYLARLGDRGYVVYRAKESEEQALPAGAARVLVHMAVDPAAAATLWRYCLDLDLVAEVEVLGRPTDDTLPLLLADPRRLRSWSYEGLWLRLIDLPAALAGRRYEVAGEVVVDVSDDLLPANAGRWRLTAGPDGTACERTRAPADLALDVGALGAAYLGAGPLTRRVRAGLLDERVPGAARRIDRLFTTDPAPWCPEEF